MYDIFQLNDMGIPLLYNIAKELKLKEYKNLDKRQLIYKILDAQKLINKIKKPKRNIIMNINQGSSFVKTGKEFKQVLNKKIEGLQMRLTKRNEILDKFIDDRKRLRSYLLRSANPRNHGGHGGRDWTNNISSYAQEHIGIEEVEEIKHLCSRIFQIENEIKTYETLRNNLADDDSIALSLQELIQYGFE